MKHLLIIMALLCLFLSCNECEGCRYTTKSPETDAIRTLVSHYETGNWEEWKSMYVDTAKIFHNSTTGISADDLATALQSTLENISEYSFTHDSIYVEMIIDDKDDKWVYFWGDWKGSLKANEQTIVVPVHIAFLMAGNKVSREYAYYDNMILDEAMDDDDDDDDDDDGDDDNADDAEDDE